MAKPKKETTDDILRKYGAKLETKVKGFDENSEAAMKKVSRSYGDFLSAMSPAFSRYEKLCNSWGKSLSVKVGEKDAAKIARSIEIAHLKVTPSQVMAVSVIMMFLTMIIGTFFSLAVYLFTDVFPTGFLVMIFLLGIFLFYFMSKTPDRLALKWRLKASSQMVPAILYIVIYMKHTSNLEKAVAFAAEHLDAPLSTDFRKVFWDVQVGKFSSMKDSLDSYLETWRDFSLEFVEAFHLIESSLYEPGEERRVFVLERALQVILDGVYDKMLKYTHSAKSPLTNVYMLGIVLPTLSLAIIPLASTMVGGSLKWYHLGVLFNIIVPMMVIYLTMDVMMRRPGGYGNAALLESNPLYSEYVSRRPYWVGFLSALPLFLIGLFPLIWMYSPLYAKFGDPSWASVGLSFMGQGGIFGIIEKSGGGVVGPFGILSLVLSLFIPVAIAVVFIVASKMRTKNIILSRDKYKQVEEEFTSSLFQLGNRLGDGVPAESAFAKVMQSSRGTATEGFFKIVNENIMNLGMSVERALFDPKRGAVIYYPSDLVSTSMRIMVESVKKGLQVAARSLMSIADYVKNIKKVNTRLNDLLADILADMKSNMTFLAPLLSGIIIGLSGMITLILGSLEAMVGDLGGGGIGDAGGLTGMLGMFNIAEMIPTYWLQVVVGIYLIEVVFILTSTLITIRSGRDELENTAEVGKNLKKAVGLYFVIALFSIIGLALVGAIALRGMAG